MSNGRYPGDQLPGRLDFKPEGLCILGACMHICHLCSCNGSDLWKHVSVFGFWCDSQHTYYFLSDFYTSLICVFSQSFHLFCFV